MTSTIHMLWAAVLALSATLGGCASAPQMAGLPLCSVAITTGSSSETSAPRRARLAAIPELELSRVYK